MSSPATVPLDEEGLSAAAVRPSLGRGRVGMYAALDASVGAVPLPLVPGALMHRVRGPWRMAAFDELLAAGHE